MERYQDSSLTPRERAEDLLKKMSLEEKMAQVTGIICPPVFTDEETEGLRKRFPHGAGHISALVMLKIPDVKDVCRMQRTLQKMAMEQNGHGIPAIFHMEGLTGAMLAGAVSFPYGIGRGATFDPELEEQIGRITARQELAAGITQILYPVLDIARDPRHGRYGEPYGEDPTLAAVMGAAAVRGVQGQEVDGLRAAACGKHYMAYHKSEGGINTAHMEIGPRMLREIHGKPFQAAFSNADLHSVMPCYDASDAGPISASHEFLTEILRDEMGFDGITVSDYGAVGNVHTVHYVGETPADAGYRCMKAGMDVELPLPVGYGEELKKMFGDGRADMEVLDRAVMRVLTEKFRMGLFEHPFALEDEAFSKVFYQPGARKVSLKCARESAVLLKNNGILPLKKNIRKLAVIGPQADWANYYFGGYSTVGSLDAASAASNSQAGIAGNDPSNADKAVMIAGTGVEFSETERFGRNLSMVQPDCTTLLTELRRRFPDAQVVHAHGYHIAGSGTEEFADALEICRGADAAVLTLGGKHASGSIATMGEGVDASNINLPPCQEAFIREAAKLGIPLVGVHFDGRPVSSDTADECLDALLEAWNPGEFAGCAVAEILCGKICPSGKMPVTTARCAGQIPMYYNHPNGSSWHQGESVGFRNYVDLPHEPRYCFGYGLSYTSFEYSDLRIKAADSRGETVPQLNPDGEVEISFTLKNTGGITGTETVQLYLRDSYASMLRPVKELQGFCRAELKPGEEKRITFRCAPSQMAFLTHEMKWKIEKGRYEACVGASSEDIRLTGAFEVTEDRFTEGRNRRFWAECVQHSDTEA